MRVPLVVSRGLVAALLAAGLLGLARPAHSQELPQVKGTRPVQVAGVVSDPHNEDLLGLARVKFHGLIAGELAGIGYHVVDVSQDPTKRQVSAAPLTLVGTLKEEICDEQVPRQCRIALLWELRTTKGVVVYRVLTRAVDQAASLDQQRRGLISSALRSLLQRPRFALQLTDPDDAAKPIDEPLGFKRCARADVALPEAARAVAASYVLVESGSRLAGGAILSPDGLILSEASVVAENAPLFVRLSAQQKVPADVVALARPADLALLKVIAHFDTTCLPLRPTPLVAGQAVFGVSSPLSEERATSLTGSVVQAAREREGLGLLQTDARIAQAEGAPLLDDAGRLAGIVSGKLLALGPSGAAQAVSVQSALEALRIKPAPITDPRLTAPSSLDVKTDIGYVRDTDDPPYTISQRYTYGTSRTAHSLRSAGMWTAGIGALAVLGTWSAFRTSGDLSTHSYNRLVLFNDLSWGLFGLGVVGFGVSFALPEAHDVVAVRVQNAQKPRFRLAIGPGSLAFSGQM